MSDVLIHGALQLREGAAQRWLVPQVRDLGDQGPVLPVRLCQLARGLGSGPWRMTSLSLRGGVAGLLLADLDAALRQAAPGPAQPHFLKAARAVLDALPPPEDAPAAGGVPHGELTRAAARAGGADLAAILTVLDDELRLVTPWPGRPGADPAERCYRLADDLHVPALRQWLRPHLPDRPRRTCLGRLGMVVAMVIVLLCVFGIGGVFLAAQDDGGVERNFGFLAMVVIWGVAVFALVGALMLGAGRALDRRKGGSGDAG